MTMRNAATVEPERATDVEILDAVRRHPAAVARLKADLELRVARLEAVWDHQCSTDPHGQMGPRYWADQARTAHRGLAACRAVLAAIEDPDADLAPDDLPTDDGEAAALLTAYSHAGDVRALVSLVGGLRVHRDGLARKLSQDRAALAQALDSFASGWGRIENDTEDELRHLRRVEEQVGRLLPEIADIEAKVGRLDASLAAFDGAAPALLAEAIGDQEAAARGVFEARRLADRQRIVAEDAGLAGELQDLDEQIGAVGEGGLLVATLKERRADVARRLKASAKARSEGTTTEARALVQRAVAGDLKAVEELDRIVDSCPGAFRAGLSRSLQDALVSAMLTGEHPAEVLMIVA